MFFRLPDGRDVDGVVRCGTAGCVCQSIWRQPRQPTTGPSAAGADFQSDGRALVDVVLPQDLALYRVLVARRPVGRPHLATVLEQEACILLVLAVAFFLHLRAQQIAVLTAGQEVLALTPPCSRCAIPTGSWCCICDRPLCTRCDDAGLTPCCASCTSRGT